MNHLLLKNTFRSIRKSFSRFVAIMLIVATGFAFLAGIKAAGPDMLATAAAYYKDNNLMDLRVQSDLGLTMQDAEAIASVEGVKAVMPQKFVDALIRVNGNVESDIDGSQISTRAYGLSLKTMADYAAGIRDKSFINRPDLLEGRFPMAENECLVDASKLSTPDSFQLGNVITLEGDGTSIGLSLSVTSFTIVGIIRSPYYISFERGNSLVGSGKIGTFLYIPDSVILSDYYSEIYVTVNGTEKYAPYSDDYFSYLEPISQAISEIAPTRLSVRAASLNDSLPGKINEAQKALTTLVSEAQTKFSDAEAKVTQLESLATNGDAILAAAQAEYNQKFSEQSTVLSSRQDDYAQKVQAYNELNTQVAEAKKEWNIRNTEYQTKLVEYNEKNQEWQAAVQEIKNGEATVSRIRNLLNTTQGVFNSLQSTQGAALNQEDVQNIVGVLEAVNPDLYNAIRTLTAQGMAVDAMALIRPQIAEYEEQLNAEDEKLAGYREKADAAEAELKKANEELTSGKAALDEAKKKLDGYDAQLTSAKTLLDTYGDELQKGGYALSIEQIKARQNLATLQSNVENADTNLEKAKKELEDARKTVNDQIVAAETIINSGNNLLGKISTAAWHISDRNGTPGYSSLGEAAENVNRIAYIFPIFFVLVASMVSLTTITRMVEDERLQLGTLKSLGFTDRQIMSKYLLYALIASVLGSVLGAAIGIYAFPYAIYAAYSIMYELPPLIISVPWGTIFIGFLVFSALSLCLAYYVCHKELGVVPSVLMRAKAPKAGKRILLEKIPSIWSKLGFISKVTIRNTFRAPKRCAMTILGIAGCTALLLASLGLYDSVSAIMTNQYGENGISRYDMQIVFDTPQTPGHSSVLNSIARDRRVDSVMLTSMTSLTGGSERSDDTLDVYVLVPEDPEVFKTMVDLRRTDKKPTPAALDDTGIIITEKFAEVTHTEVGQSVTLTTAEGQTATAPVRAIVENYTFDYAYMTDSVYRAIFGTAPQYHYALGNLSEEAFREEEEEVNEDTASVKALLASELMDKVGVTAVAYTTDTIETFREVIRAMTIVVALLIIAAVGLEMVVLYNLSNVNISERIREIATLKVVGFYDREVSSYIYRENIILTLLGAVFGLGLGVYLHRLIVHFIVIDTVSYGKEIAPLSFLIAFAATILFSLVVNLLMYKKLQKVSMVESFKSNE